MKAKNEVCDTFIHLFSKNVEVIENVSEYFQSNFWNESSYRLWRCRVNSFKLAEKTSPLARSGIEYTLYVKDQSRTLQQQVPLPDYIDIILDEQYISVRFNSLNSDIGTEPYVEASLYVKAFFDTSVSWRTFSENKVTSAVCCLQVFGDEFQMSLFAGTIQFYPLLVTLQQFHEGSCRHQILSGASAIADIPIAPNPKEMGTKFHQKLNPTKQ